MPLKAIESPNAKANLIMFVGGPGLKHGKLKKIGIPLIGGLERFLNKAGFYIIFFSQSKKKEKRNKSLKYRTTKKQIGNNISKVYEIIKKKEIIYLLF